MINIRHHAACAAALTITFGAVVPAHALALAPMAIQEQDRDTARQAPTVESQGRTGRARRERERAPQPPAPPSPEEIRAQAQTQATAAGLSCQVTEATLLGQDAAGQPGYEAACAEGPGYVLIASTPPAATNCIELAGVARQTRESDPTADVGVVCSIAQNVDPLPFIKTYAQEAGIRCTIDDAVAVGKSANGELIFEIGCANTDGFRIDKGTGGWVAMECLQVVSTPSGTCRFTTPQEQASTVKTWLAGTDAAACDVQQARYMGRNANGAFYEAKCAAGDGYIARLDTAKAVQRVYPCAEAAQIGGGCTLTTAAAAPATTEPTPAPATE